MYNGRMGYCYAHYPKGPSLFGAKIYISFIFSYNKYIMFFGKMSIKWTVARSFLILLIPVTRR